MTDEQVAHRIAGIAAIVSALSWIAWAVLNGVTHGQMDAAGPSQATITKTGQLLTVSWNLCLVPTALMLLQWLRDEGPNLMLICTVLGVISLAFWAYGGATSTISGPLEVTYLMLSGVWWVGIGCLAKRRRRTFGTFTILLGVLAIFDGFLSFFETVPIYLLAPAGLKIPFANIWACWVGVILLKRATGSPSMNSEIKSTPLNVRTR